MSLAFGTDEHHWSMLRCLNWNENSDDSDCHILPSVETMCVTWYILTPFFEHESIEEICACMVGWRSEAAA